MVQLLVLIWSHACGWLAGTEKQFEDTQQGTAIGAVKRHCPSSSSHITTKKKKNWFAFRTQKMPFKKVVKTKPVRIAPNIFFAAFLNFFFLYHLANRLRLADLGEVELLRKFIEQTRLRSSIMSAAPAGPPAVSKPGNCACEVRRHGVIKHTRRLHVRGVQLTTTLVHQRNPNRTSNKQTTYKM